MELGRGDAVNPFGAIFYPDGVLPSGDRPGNYSRG